jgi:acyl-CoA synthetase (AMP-forming)/AMP-acid ligase II
MRQIERAPAHRVAVESAQRSVTHGQLRELSSRLANALLGLGLSRGDRVAYAAGNHLEYFVLEMALLKSGLVKVPLNPRLTGSELIAALGLADVRVVVADDGTANAIEQAGGLDPSVVGVVVGSRDAWRGLNDLAATGSANDPRVPVGPDDIYHIRFSSGSTGAPKGIAISHRAARAAILGNTWAMSVCAPVDRPRTLQVAPLVYAGGWSVLPTWLRHGTSVVLPGFDADETLRALKENGIDWMFAVPTMLRRISQSSSLELLRSAPLSCLMLAGEPAAVPALALVSEHTDALAQSWGQTEAPASTTLLDRDEMKRPELWTSIGRPIPGVEFSLLVGDDVLDVPEPGVEGELVIRSQSITSGLLGADEEYARRRLDDGWWRTSDLASFDEEGRISIVGRARETIITGGTNIQPVEIERALEVDDLVVEAVVVGVPDPQWGETPAALVHAPALHEQDDDRLWSSLRDRLAGFKQPRHLYVSAQPIPRSSGESKVARGEMKRLLRSWVEDSSTVPAHVRKVEKPRG